MNAQAADHTNDAFVVTRKVAVPGASGAGASAAIRDRLEECPGVLAAKPDGARATVRITYDASQIGFGQLIDALAAAGYPSGSGVWTRLKRTWFCYLDSNARANAGGGKAACCSRPSDIYASRSRKQ